MPVTAPGHAGHWFMSEPVGIPGYAGHGVERPADRGGPVTLPDGSSLNATGTGIGASSAEQVCAARHAANRA